MCNLVCLCVSLYFTWLAFLRDQATPLLFIDMHRKAYTYILYIFHTEIIQQIAITTGCYGKSLADFKSPAHPSVGMH